MIKNKIRCVIGNGLKNIQRGSVTFVFTVMTAMFFTGCAAIPKHATLGKCYHVGLVWLKEPGNAEHREKIVAAAHSFAREIPEVEFLSIGRSPASSSSYVDDS